MNDEHNPIENEYELIETEDGYVLETESRTYEVEHQEDKGRVVAKGQGETHVLPENVMDEYSPDGDLGEAMYNRIQENLENSSQTGEDVMESMGIKEEDMLGF